MSNIAGKAYAMNLITPIKWYQVPNHGRAADGRGTGTMVIQADPKGDKPPFFCSGIPRFVETRGGEYFFIPSLTARRVIGAGIIDPT